MVSRLKKLYLWRINTKNEYRVYLNVGMAKKATIDGRTLHILLQQHSNQLSINNTTTKLVQTMHEKIWWPRIRNLYHTPHILNCLEITRRGNKILRLNTNTKKWRNKENICKIRSITTASTTEQRFPLWS